MTSATLGDAEKSRVGAFVGDLAGHGRLSEHYRQVEQQVRLYIASTNVYNEPDDWSVVIQHHRPLAAALIARDPERAEAEARLHNEVFGKKLMSSMSDEQQRKSRQ